MRGREGVESDEYCREIEAYLCRKNDGHLVRIVGPGFDCVRAWAEEGVPIRVASAGIDRYFERYYRRGRRRRPVRVEFCDADVRDAFDDWRRATGIAVLASSAAARDDDEAIEEPARRRASLPAHIEAAINRLTSLRASTTAQSLGAESLEALVRALDRLLVDARRARGDARDAVLDTLEALDRQLVETTMAALDATAAADVAGEVERELAPFKPRMTADAFAAATAAARARIVRERLALPRLAY